MLIAAFVVAFKKGYIKIEVVDEKLEEPPETNQYEASLGHRPES